jgi:hypothetical protein
MSSLAKPLPLSTLNTPSDSAQFPFETIAELKPMEDVVGPRRAVESVRFAIGMRHGSYKIFALGPEGTGKHSLISRFLERTAVDEALPSDWCYVDYFAEPHRPRAICLAASRGRPFQVCPSI